ncbi:DUF971 domain-containing protein [Cohaesibacter sp. CAU 1516]|uniref:gamma-butyrobetaine hydroxylase-like domain-containing protein n=1 Tax=Cohaesibacter sp. CAU 1516 TaxID=2576038 RepID=UPI0010FD63CD|nr:DUF971 domain-containing protein [Cohaesibacter sp. CAU 1516]TLP43352.1 DUF971 domain-containing protein [Cohaesibacter sp. CAU 1516]
MTNPWPTELRLSEDRKTLTISFDTAESYVFTAEFLRVTSPSAEVQGHSEQERKTVGGKRDVEIMKIEPVGNYAVRISFTDLHDTGYFSWDYFLKSGRDHEAIWNAYLQALEENGLSRD